MKSYKRNRSGIYRTLHMIYYQQSTPFFKYLMGIYRTLYTVSYQKYIFYRQLTTTQFLRNNKKRIFQGKGSGKTLCGKITINIKPQHIIFQNIF